MLRISGLIIILITLGWILFKLRSERATVIASWRWLSEQWRVNFKNSILVLSILFFLILAVSGLIPFLILGKPLSGFLLLVHVAVSPLFILCVVILTILWIYQHRFLETNWQWLRLQIRKRDQKQKDVKAMHEFWGKVHFWLILLSSIGLSSIVLSMYPLFGTVGMEFFMTLHKLSAIVMTFSVAMYLLLLIRSRTESFSKVDS